MNVNRSELLGLLPAYQDAWVTIHDNQTVKDIIREVLAAHKEFAEYYDSIAPYFEGDTVQEICDNLYTFCKSEIRYREESEDDQTTALPTGLLTRGFGDCKHYASFCGGVLDALNRMGYKIDWCYRFGCYNWWAGEPHHVFISVKDGDEEIWIDPTPKANSLTPLWSIDKKITTKTKNLTMPLRRNIAGIGGSVMPVNTKLVNFAGKWYAIMPDGMGGAKVGDILDDAGSILANLSSIFGGGGKGKKGPAQKMFDMFPLMPGSNAGVIQQTLDAINAHMAQDPNGRADAGWSAAYQDILRQYSNALALVQLGQPMPNIQIPAIGQPSYASLPPGTPDARQFIGLPGGGQIKLDPITHLPVQTQNINPATGLPYVATTTAGSSNTMLYIGLGAAALFLLPKLMGGAKK